MDYNDIVKKDIMGNFGDKDQDGYINILDCDPNDPEQDGILGDIRDYMSSVSRSISRSTRQRISSGYGAVREGLSRGPQQYYETRQRIKRAEPRLVGYQQQRVGELASLGEKGAHVKELEKERLKLKKLETEKRQKLEGYTTLPLYEKSQQFSQWWDKHIVPDQLRPDTPKKYRTLSDVGIGIVRAPGQVVAGAGMTPIAIEYAAREPTEFAAAVVPGMVASGKGMYRSAKENPAQFTGEMIGQTLIGYGGAKVIRAAPKASPHYRGPARGVKPFTGEPGMIGKLKGQKRHPTPTGEMKVLLKESVFDEPASYYHGTDLGFVKKIRQKKGVTISPDDVMLKGDAGVEASLFLGNRPYTRFATRGKVVKTGKGPTSKEFSLFELEQQALGRKTVKSPALRKLTKERVALESQLKGTKGLKRRSIESKLYDKNINIEKQIVKDYKARTGQKARIREEPGAFLELEGIPIKPSQQIIKKAYAREALRIKEKAGSISSAERSTLRGLERDLSKLTAEEYFSIPKGQIYPGTKPMRGHEWKGIPELEYTARAGTKVYPVESFRTRAYQRFGVTKGTSFTYDPLTGRYVELVKITTKKPTVKPAKTLIDVPGIVEPFKRARKPSLSSKQKAQITRYKAEIAKARTAGDYNKASRLSARVRQIESRTPYKPAPVFRVDDLLNDTDRKVTGRREIRERSPDDLVRSTMRDTAPQRRGLQKRRSPDDLVRSTMRDTAPQRRGLQKRRSPDDLVRSAVRATESRDTAPRDTSRGGELRTSDTLRDADRRAVPRDPYRERTPLRELRPPREPLPPPVQFTAIDEILRDVGPKVTRPKAKSRPKKRHIKDAELFDDIYRKRQYSTLTPQEFLKL